MSGEGPSFPVKAAVLLGMLLLPGATVLSGDMLLVWVSAFPALIIIPGVLFGGRGSQPGRGDADGGGGQGPPPRQDPPRPPSDGLPLPDASGARQRLRDQHRVGRVRSGRRRERPERERRPRRAIPAP